MRKAIYILITIFFNSCDCHYDNFKITGVTMQSVTLKDSTGINKNFYMFVFNTKLCNPSISFLGGGLEPGIKGIDGKITGIEIYTRSGKIISQNFRGWDMDIEGTITDGTEELPFLSSPNLSDLVKSINNGDRQGIGERIKFMRLFYSSSGEPPYLIIVSFKNKQIISKVINEKVDYKVINMSP